MKTEIIKKVKSIPTMKATMLLAAMLCSIILTASTQEEESYLYALAYDELISEVDSKIMSHILTVKSALKTDESFNESFKIENWMIDLSEWEEDFSKNEILEEKLQMENWMIQLEEWGNRFDTQDQGINSLNKISANFEIKEAESIHADYFEESNQLENWMLEITDWDLMKYDNLCESYLELKDWMTDLSEWR